MRRKIQQLWRSSRTIRFAVKLLVAAVILELTLFQFPSYRLIFGDYPHTVLSPAQAEAENCFVDENGFVTVSGTDEISLTFREINSKVGTVYVDLEYKSDKARQFSFFADLTDETGHYYRMKLIDSVLINGSSRSQYEMVQLSGKTSTARFRIAGLDDEDCCTIKSIELNRTIPFDFMLLRVLLITGLGTLAYAIVFSGKLALAWEDNRYICRLSSALLTILAVCLLMIMALTEIPRGQFMKQFRQTEGDEITQELVEAFENGQVWLVTEPEEDLLALDNPYDWGIRFYTDIVYQWDHVLYNGKYYSYYGIAPLLLFLPYHKLTGYFFPTNIAVMLFACLGLIFLTLTYNAVVRRWFRRIPSGIYIAGLVILLTSCGVWFSAGRAKFYEIAISSGFACLAAGAYLLLTSGVIGSERLRNGRTAAASLMFGLAVMCRPTLAVYAVCACVYFVFGARKALRGKVASGARDRKGLAVYLLCAALPLAALGAFQMWYNYTRFGSVFEFGIQYSLTINDFTHTEMHLHLVLIGLYNFLLAPPAFIPDYPFVTTPFSLLGVNGYYFVDDGNTSGVIFLALPVWGYLLAGKALRQMDLRQKVKSLLLVGLPCVVMPLVVVCSVWESGYAVRYTADFSWPVIMGALVLAYYLYARMRSHTAKWFFSVFMAFSAVWAIVVNSVQIYNFALPRESYPHYADALCRLFQIWH